MTRYRVVALSVALLMAAVVFAQKVEKEGKAWLSQYTEPAAINVAGKWGAGDWGTITLNQAEGSRELTGSCTDGWVVDGVVSGKKIYLLFSHKGTVNYCAELEAESADLLTGQYRRGMMSGKEKLRPIVLKK